MHVAGIQPQADGTYLSKIKIYLSIYLSLSLSLSIYLSIYLFIYLSIYLSIDLLTMYPPSVIASANRERSPACTPRAISFILGVTMSPECMGTRVLYL